MDFQRYLLSKVSVDDRALHPRLIGGLRERWPAGGRVLELGAGIGTMAERLRRQGFGGVRYHLLDSLPENLNQARTRLGPGDGDWSFEYLTQDLQDVLATESGPWDAVVAHAFLDLFDLPALIPRLARLGRPGTPFLLTLNFDHATGWRPSHRLDQRVLAAYHGTMNPKGVGAQLFDLLPAAGLSLVDAAASDWAVWPRAEGGYPALEAEFLNFLLDFFEGSLQAHPDLQPGELAEWIAYRRGSVARSEAVFWAHQWDFLAVT